MTAHQLVLPLLLILVLPPAQRQEQHRQQRLGAPHDDVATSANLQVR
jgi:hypothetical protein